MRLLKVFLFLSFIGMNCAFAESSDLHIGGTITELLESAHNIRPTKCASTLFLQALKDNSDKIFESDSEKQVRAWAYNTMLAPSVLAEVIKCPEIQSAPEEETIIFTPIEYEFPMGRTLTINYSTQPKVLRQKMLLAGKRSLPNGDPNPKLMDPNDPAIYINTDPAWYAIFIAQHGALSEFVGSGKNNTVSVKYIEQNIDKIYPHGYYCTSRSAWANNHDTINRVVRQVVDLENDTNDYYVAGDINLGWVMYAEIAADIILTIATAGVGEGVMISLKSARAARTSKNLIKAMNGMIKASKNVERYANLTRQIASHTDDIAKLNKTIKKAKQYEKAIKNAEKAQQTGRDASKYLKEAENIYAEARKIDPKITKDALQDTKKLTSNRDELKNSVKEMKKNADKMVKDSDEVAKYKESADTFKELWKYNKNINAFRRPQTGNVLTRNLKKIGSYAKSIKASQRGAKTMTKAAKLARGGMGSTTAKIGDWLVDSTLKHGARLARVERDMALGFGTAIAFLGDMYDYTSTTSNEYSNGIDFKPFGLLSADDLEGQENVVNYGMWLMWLGNSSDPEDDDAAYLQAMDFASKLFYELDEFQDENGANCDVDIYVVRPIIRLDETNMKKPTGEMFYLFMNDTPWTTAKQFNELVPDLNEWERAQQGLYESDPENKFHTHNSEEETSEEITEGNE